MKARSKFSLKPGVSSGSFQASSSPQTLGAVVEAGAHVDHHGRLVRDLVEGLGGHQHAAQRFDGQIHSGEARYVAGPGAGGVDHGASGDEPSRGLDAGHAVRVHGDAGDVGIAHQAHAALHGLQHEAGHDAVRVHEAIGGAETAAQDVV